MEHGKLVCEKCSVIMAQCKCLEGHSNAILSICNRCKGKDAATAILSAFVDIDGSPYMAQLKSGLEMRAEALSVSYLALLKEYELVVKRAKKLFTATCGSEFKDAKEELRLLVEKET